MSTAPRHARRRTRDPLGYRITKAVINTLFTIVLVPVATILCGPMAYVLGA